MLCWSALNSCDNKPSGRDQTQKPCLLLQEIVAAAAPPCIRILRSTHILHHLPKLENISLQDVSHPGSSRDMWVHGKILFKDHPFRQSRRHQASQHHSAVQSIYILYIRGLGNSHLAHINHYVFFPMYEKNNSR